MTLDEMRMADTTLVGVRSEPEPYVCWDLLVQAYERLTAEYHRALCGQRAWAWGEWELARDAKRRASEVLAELAAITMQMRETT